MVRGCIGRSSDDGTGSETVPSSPVLGNLVFAILLMKVEKYTR